jgi:hypothetical protein
VKHVVERGGTVVLEFNNDERDLFVFVFVLRTALLAS